MRRAVSRVGVALGASLLAALAPGVLRAQSATAGDTAGAATVYLREGGMIRGRILADNGANGLRIQSTASGSVYLVPAAQIDSVVRPKPATPAPAEVRREPQSISVAAVPPAVDSAPPTAPDTAAQATTVTFISGTEIYIGAGRLEGLAEGSEVEVLQNDVVVATLRVKFLASHRAACEVVGGSTAIALGDAVRFHRGAAPGDQLALADVAPLVSRPRRLSGPGLHGRFGTRYLRATTTTESGGQALGSNGFNQPSLDARVNGTNLGGSPVSLALDLRTRRTTTTSGGATQVDGRTRVYQAVMFWNTPGSAFRAAAGRQYLTAVTSIGLFDGALVELNSSTLTFGAFAGFEPDLVTLGFSGAVHDFGAYATLHNRPGTSSALSATLGAVGSYEGSEARREWGIAQVSANNRYLSLYLLQELDYYRPWKLEGPNAESSALSATSQFANLSVRPSPWLALNATYDKRRSVPTLRDFTNPETEFDDTYRQGYGGGVQLTGTRVYGGGDWRRSTGGVAGGANSFTATLGINRLTRINLGLSARATWYRNDVLSADTTVGTLESTGQLYSGRLSLDPVGVLHLDLNAGLREEDNPALSFTQHSSWYGADADINLARAWFLNFSLLRQKDEADPGSSTLTQVYGGLTWRF